MILSTVERQNMSKLHSSCQSNLFLFFFPFFLIFAAYSSCFYLFPLSLALSSLPSLSLSLSLSLAYIVFQKGHCKFDIKNPAESLPTPRNPIDKMAEGATKHLFLCLLFVLSICTSGASPLKGFQKKRLEREEQEFHSSNRELLDNFQSKTTQHDTTYPSTTTIVTVPSTNPVTVTPNPDATPVTVPATTPVTVPPTNPVTSPVPITNPVTTPGGQPATSPVTTNPVTTPVTNPSPPATTGSPAVSGQSWCVAKSGSSQTALQTALDYACGIGGADCSAIQQGASCYNPNTLQNHASYAFNSYYQKHSAQTSCDFGGAATLTNSNPSSGSCVFPSSSSSSPSSSSSSSPPNTASTAPPATQTAPPTTPSSSSGGTGIGSGSPPAVLNATYPSSGGATVFGDSPPSFNSSTSIAASLQPFIGYILMGTSVVTARFILDM